MDATGFATDPYAASAPRHFQMESTGANRMEVVPSAGGLRHRRCHNPPEKGGTGSHRMEATPSEGLRRPSQGRRKMVIVKTLTGAILKLQLDLSETIREIKCMIEKSQGIPPDQQRLVFNRLQGEDGYTLKEYGFQYGTKIKLVLRLRGGGPRPTLPLPPTPTIDIYVTKLDGKIFRVKVWRLTSPVCEVKKTIYQQEGIRQTEQHHLVFCGQPLVDDRTLADYDIQEDCILDLVPGPRGGDNGLLEIEGSGAHPTEAEGLRLRTQGAKTIIIYRDSSREFTKLELDLSETIARVKAMIYAKEGTHPALQILKFKQRQATNSCTLEHGNCTLEEYGFQYGTIIHLYEDFSHNDQGSAPKIEIFVKKLDGEIFTLWSCLTSRIYEVRSTIREQEDIRQLGQQHLVFHGQPLDDDKTLADYNIQEESTLHLAPGSRHEYSVEIYIFVKKHDGDTLSFERWNRTCPIKNVKQKFCLRERIPQTQRYHLVFREQPLDDDKTLEDYNIEDYATLHLAPRPRGCNSGLPDEAMGTNAAVVDEGSSHRHRHGQEGQSSWSQSQGVLPHHEDRNEQIREVSSNTTEVVNDTVPLVDEFNKQQQEQIRWSKYSVKALVFAITTLVTYLGSASTLFSTGNMVFKISIGAFFIADAMLSIMMPPKIGSVLVYLSCFLLVLVSYLLLVSFNKYYGYAILPVLLPIVAALLQHKLLPGLTQHQRSNNNEGDHTVDIEVPAQAHGADEEDGQHFDRIFELSADIVNCGGLITVVFGNSMVGPVSAVGFLFFYTVSLGLYLMMVTTVRTVVLTAHARYLAILLKVLLVITLITALMRGVHR